MVFCFVCPCQNRHRQEIIVVQPGGDAPVQPAPEAAEGLVDGFEITAGGPGDLFARLTLVITGAQDLAGAGRQGVQTELQRRLAGRGGFVGFVEGFGNGFDGFRREEEREAGTAAAGFKDLAGGDAPRPGSKGPAQIVVIKLLPERAADFLKNVLTGMRIADHRADECPQIRLRLAEKVEEIG